jgi:uncharacterized protein DUF5661
LDQITAGFVHSIIAAKSTSRICCWNTTSSTAAQSNFAANSKAVPGRKEPTSKQLEISLAIAARFGLDLELDWTRVDPDEFRLGLELEIEREWRNPDMKLNQHDLVCIGKIVLAHMAQCADYYTRLDQFHAGEDLCGARHPHEVWRKRLQSAGSRN